MEMKRILGPTLAAILAVGVIVAIVVSNQKNTEVEAIRTAASAIVEIKGMIGSEKESYFADPRVMDRLASKGLHVTIEKVGSRAIASRNLTGYDFGFPAGAPAAIALQKKVGAKQIYPTFYTPMAVASWKMLIPVLTQEGIVKQTLGNYYIVDMKRLLEMSEKGVRWRDLKGNDVYKTSKSILISSTDVRKSNSGAMYLSLASYVINDNNVIDNAEQANKVLPFATALFLRQGLQESSSAGPFEDYTTMGVGKAPLVMIYESQFLEYQSKRAVPNKDMVLLYPQPTIYTKHIVVPFTENGKKLGELLSSDPVLQQLATEYGYRTSSPEHFAEFLKSKKLTAPTLLVDVIDPPSFETLEYMIGEISKKFM